MVEPSEMAAHAVEALRSHAHLPEVPPAKKPHPLGAGASLGVDEVVALDTVGYEPAGVVTGSSVFDIPVRGRWVDYTLNLEVEVFTHGLHEARLAALTRVRSAARKLGADGVIGIDFGLPGIPKDGNEVRFSAAGLAVRSTSRADVQPRADSTQNPFTSSLSGHDFALLVRSGYLSVGLVMGVCVFHVGRRDTAETLKNLPHNTELSVITEALYQSRELAMGRMQGEALSLDSDGIVGVRVEEESHAWGSRVIEFLAIGTAIELVADEYQSVEPALVMPVSDHRSVADRRPKHG